MGDADDERALAAYYDDFGRHWAHGTSPLYEDWACAIAEDAEVVRRLTALPRRQQQANLLFAAARRAGVPLHPYAEVRDELLDAWDRISEISATHSTQTNEPGRAATWLPPLSRLDGPVALLEVGAAGGLCLFPDHCRVTYTTPPGEFLHEPDAAGPTIDLRCTVDDAAAVPTGPVEVAWRAGLDLAPIDVRDPESLRWLELLVWPGPDHDARIARLRQAADAAASAPPRIVSGDLVDDLEALAATAPADAHLVVFHSAVLMYPDAAKRDTFVALVGDLGRRLGRPVTWLSNESRGTFPALDDRLPADLRAHHRFVQRRNGTPIALAGQHGATYEITPFA